MAQRKNEAKWIESRQRWQINVQAEGERKTFACSMPGRKGKIAAERKADAWLDERLVGENTRAEVMLDRWFECLNQSTSLSHYRQQGGYIRNWIKPVIGTKKIGNITQRDLQDIINRAYKEGGLAEKTLKNLRACLMAFMKYCRTFPATHLHPEGLIIPAGARRSEKEIVPVDGLKTLFTVPETIYRRARVEDFYINAYRFAVCTGMRPGELIGLQWANVKDDKVTIVGSINNFNENTQGKNKNARRTIGLSRHAQGILEAQRVLLRRHGMISRFVFPDHDGGFITQQNLRRAWKRYCAANGITQAKTPYEMRHTFVSIMDEMPEGLKKMVVGHSKNMDTEGQYGHQKAGDLERAAAYIDAALEGILR